MENSNKVESVTAINSEKEVERSIVKNSEAVSDTADQNNTVIDTKVSQPIMNEASNVHYIYKHSLKISRNKFVNRYLMLVSSKHDI